MVEQELTTFQKMAKFSAGLSSLGSNGPAKFEYSDLHPLLLSTNELNIRTQ